MKSISILQRKNPVYEKCPSCSSSGKIYRSRSRNWREKFIKRFTFFRIYRCKQCGWRGYRSTMTLTVKSLQNLLIYTSIIIIIVLVVRLILTRIFS